jgi:Mg2+ and Co2+ transporter CorA
MQHLKQVSTATIIMAVMTLVLSLYVVYVEATVDEDIAKALVMPAWYILIFTSMANVASAVWFKRR